MATVEASKGSKLSTMNDRKQPSYMHPVESVENGIVATETEVELAAALQSYVPGTDAEKNLVRKIDFIMIPMVWLMYILAILDRSNIGNARIAGMADELNLSDDRYATALSIFFIGYLCCEVPSNLILTRARPSWYLSGIMLVWGAVCSCMAVMKTYSGLLALRFILGCIEAGFFPGVLFIMSCWYKKNEIGKRFSIFYTASVFAGSLGGIMAGAITSHMNGAHGIAGWRWLFIIEGAVTVGFAVIAFFVLLDFPQNTSRLSSEERLLAVTRILYDKQTNSARHGIQLTHWQALKACFADPRTYLVTLLSVLNLGSQTIVYFIPTIVKAVGYSSTTAQWMTVPIYMTAATMMIIFSFTADRLGDRRWHVTGQMVLGFVCSIVCVASDSAKVRYVMLCFFIGGLYSSWPLTLTWITEIVSLPAEKRACTMAVANSVGNLASVYGSRLWPSSTGPRYIMGFSVVSAFLGVGSVLAAMIPVIIGYFPSEGRTKAEKEILKREEILASTEPEPRTI